MVSINGCLSNKLTLKTDPEKIVEERRKRRRMTRAALSKQLLPDHADG